MGQAKVRKQLMGDRYGKEHNYWDNRAKLTIERSGIIPMTFDQFFSAYCTHAREDGTICKDSKPLSNVGYQYIVHSRNDSYVAAAFLFINGTQHKIRLIVVGTNGAKKKSTQLFIDAIHDDCLEWAMESGHFGNKGNVLILT